MHYLVPPPPVRLRDPQTKQEGDLLSFVDYAMIKWLNDPRPQRKGPIALHRWMTRVVEPICDFTPEDACVPLEDEDFRLLEEIVKTPLPPSELFPGARILAPLVDAQCFAFARAVLEAPTKDPREKASLPDTVAAPPPDGASRGLS